MHGGSWIQRGGQGGADRQEIRRQLEQYVPEAHRRGSLSVFCLCDNGAVAVLARDEAANIAREHNVALHAVAVLGSPIRPLYTPMHWYVEYERSATTPVAIRGKLRPYFHVAGRGHNCPVIFICETRRAAEIFREQYRNLQQELGVTFLLITSTYAQVEPGDQFDTCWNLDGHPARLF